MRFVFTLMVLALGAPWTWAQQDLTREQALSALLHESTPARIAAVRRLGEIGVSGDAGRLLAALRDESEDVRDAAELAIWGVWSRSGDVEVDRLFKQGVGQMQEGNLTRAVSTFTEVIRLKPEFAEGWNKRATLHFMRGEYLKSLQDCDEVMKLNPEHFGALAGYGQIYLRLSQPERALEYFQRALNINPNMNIVAKTMDKLERDIQRKRDGQI